MDIVRLLAERRCGMTSSEIAETTSIDGKRLAKMLNNLERCDFIMKFRYYGKNRNDVIYKLTDFYTLFYIKYIEIFKDSYDEQWWQHHSISHSVESWQGLTFELLCLMHIRQIRLALNIGGVATEVSAWFDQADKKKAVRGSQIDLIIERADRIIHLCEMKFSQSEYRITADYEEKLRTRMALFKEKTKHLAWLMGSIQVLSIARLLWMGYLSHKMDLHNYQEWIAERQRLLGLIPYFWFHLLLGKAS